MSETKNGGRRPSLMGRLWRLILMVAIGVVLVGGGVFLGQRLVEGTQSQFWELDNIAKHARDVNRDQEAEIAALQEEVAELLKARDEQMDELVALTTTNDTVGDQLSDLQSQLDSMDGLSEDINRQADLLAGLEETLAANATDNGEMLASLTDSLTDLQTDLDTTTEQIDSATTRLDEVDGALDELAGNLDDVNADVEAVSLATTQQITAAVTALQADRSATQTNPEVLTQAIHTLRYFHAWELIARVRIHLAENNADLAIADLNNASTMLSGLIEMDSENAEALSAILPLPMMKKLLHRRLQPCQKQLRMKYKKLRMLKPQQLKKKPLLWKKKA